jgi:hypothetical protein
LLHHLAEKVLFDIEISIPRDGILLTKTWPVKPLLKLGFSEVPGYQAESGKVLLHRPITAVKLEGRFKGRPAT